MTKAFRYSVPTLLTARGAGFGNEVIAWGKAFIGAQELGLRTLHPAWALNQRGYRHDFGTSVLDWPAQRALRALPSVVVDAEMATTDSDYAEVMRRLGGKVSGKPGPLAVFHASGMTGGYYGIRRARGYLRTAVSAPKHVANDMYQINDRLNPRALTVAMHIRAGDFQSNIEGPKPGQFNTMLPLDWYMEAGRNLRSAFGNKVQFVILTDDEDNLGIKLLASELDALPLPTRGKPLLSDIETMASADLLVCSVSSLSMFAAFISDKPYLWYGPHLGERDGVRSIWGHERGQGGILTATNASVHSDPLFTRGTPVMESGKLGDGLLSRLETELALKDQRRDLIMYGTVR